MSALKEQVGGDHYKKQGLQPFEITFANFGYFGLRAAVYTKVNKYLNRDKETHREDIQKAIHCLQCQLEFLDRHEADQPETIMHNRRSMDNE
jgi:cytochrome c-type biogenesis protein CcmH/NrfF